MAAKVSPEDQTEPSRLWTPAFALLCIAVLLGYSQQSLLTPTVPLYVADRGGSATFAGLALLAFSVPSFLVRPLFGYLSDSWSAAGVLALGLSLLAVGALVFLVPILALLFVASAVRGLGWAGVNTGGYTLLAGAAPPARRGEAAGYYSAVTSSATILLPAVALWIIDAPGGGFEAVFLLATFVALSGLPITRLVRPPGARSPAKARPAASIGGALDRGVLLAGALNLASTTASPAVGAFLPLYARHIGISGIGLYYVTAGVTSILIRPLLGRKSDSMGRSLSLAIGFSSQLFGLLMILLAQNLPMILVGGVFTSLGFSLNSAATTALAMDLANPEQQGKSMATFSISFQLGAGVGAILAGTLADAVGFRGMYAGSMAIIALGLGLLLINWKILQPRSTAHMPATG